ncbi:hypothetical protein MJO29_007914 [Puccinia striiformis f. sp. tritici]|nr:hypothetical protein MJO29_007914 [Puccinia striiformis f. sp. tritici]
MIISQQKPSSYLQSKLPNYQIKTRFDFQSVNLALNQEWIELDLFRYGLAQFSAKEFEEAGLNAEDRYLIQFMADQEVSHATVLSNMLGPRAAKQCKYKYPFKTVKQFLDFCQKLTRWGESGVYGFLSFLENPNSAQILSQSIATEARQQMRCPAEKAYLGRCDDDNQIFRQFEGLFPMPVYHVPGIPQAWAWTLLHPYLVECPRTNPYIEFDIFPRLEVLNNPDPFQTDPRLPAITHNRTSLSQSGRQFAAWASQYNVTYSKLDQVNEDSATTVQPFAVLFPGQVEYPVINGTMFVLLTDTDLHVTPSNITALNQHIVAGPAIYQAD